MIELFLKQRQIFYIEEDEIQASSGNYYEIGDRIGSGGNGAVYECIDQSGCTYAIKFLLHFDAKSKMRFEQEISLMQKLNHPHLVKYIDSGQVKVKKRKKDTNFEDSPFVIMEKADSNVMEYLKKNKSIPYEQYVPQFRGLCEALGQIHDYSIHRDIKPENVLIKGETWILSDFGLCEFLDPEEHKDITKENEKIGPIFWISPEAVNKYYFGTDDIGPYSDVYQLGMLFSFVLSRRYPGGIVTNDYCFNTTDEIKNVLIETMSNSSAKRPQNGSELLKLFNEATIEK